YVYGEFGGHNTYSETSSARRTERTLTAINRLTRKYIDSHPGDFFRLGYPIGVPLTNGKLGDLMVNPLSYEKARARVEALVKRYGPTNVRVNELTRRLEVQTDLKRAHSHLTYRDWVVV